MRLHFIYPDILKGAGWSGYFYSGIGYLSAAAKKAGHQVSMTHVTRVPNRDGFMSILDRTLSPKDDTLIAFSATTNMFGFVKQWAPWIKEKYKHPIMVGGVHPTLNPGETIGTGGIDAICIGEGEAPVVEFMDALQNGNDLSAIQNIWINDNGKIYKNPVRPPVADLDALPFPDRAIFDYKNLDREREGIGVFMASRGCPYNCYYCCNHAIRECIGGAKNYVRFRSVTNVIEEIKQTVRDHPFIKFLHFDDDILPINKKWFNEFAHAYSREVALPFECNIRPDLIDETTVNLLRDAGCKTLRLGLESGNAFIRNKILNRNLSEETLLKASSLCRNGGVRLYTFNMVGLPFEDMAARLDTVKFNARMQSDEQQVSIFYPYEKTRLFDICQEQGLIRKNEVTDPFRDTSLSFKTLERNQILFVAYYFTVLVRLYKLFGRLPGLFSKLSIKLSDALLSSRIAAVAVYPLSISFLRSLSKHKKLEQWARKIKHSIIDGKKQGAE